MLTLVLLLNPIAIAVGNIAMRKMRKMPELVVSSYINVTLGILSLCIVYISGDDLSPWKKFNWFDWLMTCGLSVFVLFSQTFRFKAYKEYETSKLQSLTFLIPLYQFVADITMFDATFNWIQILGLSIVIIVNVVDASIIWGCPAPPKKAVN